MGLTRSYMDAPEYPELLQIVTAYFDGQEPKIQDWFETDNPALGGQSPALMLALGRGGKLLRCVRAWQAGDFP